MTLRSLPYFVAAAVCFLVAAFLIVRTGLPKRAEGTALINTDGRRVAPEVGFIAPSFSAETVDGQTVMLNDLRGHPVLVNFWATWCGPCRLEMPELQRLYEANATQGLHIMAVNLGEAEADILAWRDTFNLTFDLVLDPELAIARRYAFRDPPSTFIIAPDGTITHIFFGPIPEGQMQDAIAQYLPAT